MYLPRMSPIKPHYMALAVASVLVLCLIYCNNNCSPRTPCKEGISDKEENYCIEGNDVKIKGLKKEDVSLLPLDARMMKLQPFSTPGSIIPEAAILYGMSDSQLEILFNRHVSSPQTTCEIVERMGKLFDGGWEVCLDARYAPQPSSCLVYSFGINNDFSFDDDMDKYGCEVHAFDPSMYTTGEHVRGQRVHFHPEGLGALDQRVSRGGHDWELSTLGTIRKKLGHAVGQRRVDIVKADVEGSEGESFRQILSDGSLSDVPQLVFEVHSRPTLAESVYARRILLDRLLLLRELYNNNFRIFSSRRNLACAYISELTGEYRTFCHELHMVNVTLAR